MAEDLVTCRELEREGILDLRHGSGAFVAEGSSCDPGAAAMRREGLVEQMADRVVIG